MRNWQGAFPSIDDLRVINGKFNENESETVLKKERRKSLTKILALSLGILAVLLVAGAAVYSFILKPAPIIEQIPVLQTQIVEMMITPTPVIAEPTLVPSPTSQYITLPLTSIVPNPPYGLKPLYLIDDTSAVFEPGEDVSWEVDNDGIGGTHHFIKVVPEGISATVSWNFDEPILDAGRYELFILDAYGAAGCSDILTYEVYASDAIISPLTGTNRIPQKTREKQRADEWISIGIYELKVGDEIRVRLLVPNKLADPSYMVGVDAVLLSQLPTLNPLEIEPLQSPDVANKDILYTMSDALALHGPLEPDTWVANPPDPGNWGGVNYADIPVDATIPYQLIYEMPHPIFPGMYEIWVWVPAEAVVPLDFEINLTYENGVAAPSTIFKDKIASIDPVAEGFQGKPLKLAGFTLENTAYLKVTAASASKLFGRFALDDLYLVMLPPEALDEEVAD
jgi:hypothetical protein